MAPNYGNVNMRLNLDSEEKIIWDKLNANNRSGHAKKILLDIFKGVSIVDVQRNQIEGMIRSVLSSLVSPCNTSQIEIDSSNEELEEDFILSSVIKG